MILLWAMLLWAGGPAPKPRAVKLATPVNAMVVPALAADTLVTTVRWTLPADDGKGPLDSLKVNLNNLAAGGSLSIKFAAPLPSQTVFRQPLPFADATWTVTAQVCTYRGTSANAAACVSATSAPFTYGLAAPLPVTGLSVGNVKVP